MPLAMPVTIPADPIVARPVLLLLHVPPPASVNVVFAPTHTTFVPLIADGNEFTVIVSVVAQPVGSIYEITEVPAVSPDTEPEPEPIVATAVLLLVQVPSDVISLNKVPPVTHAVGVPVIVAGLGLTVIVAVAIQPAILNVTVSNPAVAPVTIPDAEPMLMFGLLTVQVPAPVSKSVSRLPAAHNAIRPVMGPAEPLSVILVPLSEP